MTGYADIEVKAEVEYDFAAPEPVNNYGGYLDVTKVTINGRVCETIEDVKEALALQMEKQ